jgi:hypothetical protein
MTGEDSAAGTHSSIQVVVAIGVAKILGIAGGEKGVSQRDGDKRKLHMVLLF